MTADYTLANLTQPSAAPPSRRRRTGLIVTLCIVGVVVLGATAVTVALVVNAAGRITVNGTVTVPAQSLSGVAGDNCSGHDAYNDIQRGTEVQITDAGNATIALTQLDDGHLTSEGCVFGWTAKNVPTGKNFYGVAIGRRPGTKIPEVQMHHLVALTIG